MIGKKQLAEKQTTKKRTKEHCHGYRDEADRPIAAYTFDTCGQLFFPYNAKPVHISSWGYIDEPLLVRKKKCGRKEAGKWADFMCF